MCAMIWKQSMIFCHNLVKTFLKLHLQFVILLFYHKFPSYLCMTSSLKYTKRLQNVSCYWGAKLECESKKKRYFIVICLENCHKTVTFTNKPQNFVIFLSLTKLCAAKRSVLQDSFPVDLLLWKYIINPPESNLAKRTSVH